MGTQESKIAQINNDNTNNNNISNQEKRITIDLIHIPKTVHARYPPIQFIINDSYKSVYYFGDSIGISTNTMIHVAPSIKKAQLLKINSSKQTYELYLEYFIQELNEKYSSSKTDMKTMGFDEKEVINIQNDLDEKKCSFEDSIRYLCNSVSRFEINSPLVIDLYPNNEWFKFIYTNEYYVSEKLKGVFKPMYLYKCDEPTTTNPFTWGNTNSIPDDTDLPALPKSYINIPNIYVVDFFSNFLIYTTATHYETFMFPLTRAFLSFEKALEYTTYMYNRKPRKNGNDNWMMIIRYLISTDINPESEHIQITYDQLKTNICNIAGIALYKFI